MSLSGGRSSVKGVTDLSAVPPLILELAGLKQDNHPSGRAAARVPSGIMKPESIETFIIWGV
jgi:hypothetical protein